MTEEEMLNDNLSDHIRSVFENYEDTTADEGWTLLRQKFPAEKKDRGLFWLWYAAAAVVLLCIGLWFIQQPVKIENTLVKNQVIHNNPSQQGKSIVNKDTLKNKVISRSVQTAVQLPATQSRISTQPSQKLKKPTQLNYATPASATNINANDIPLLSKDKTVPEGLKKESIDVTTKIAFTANNKMPTDSQLSKANDKSTQVAALPEKQTSAAAIEKLLNETKNNESKPTEKITKKTHFQLICSHLF